MILTIIIFVVVFGLLVFVHEWGHFMAAKRQGIAVEEFGFGFPPRLFGFHWRGTHYTVNLIPLGGFVRIKGEEDGGENDPDSFAGRPVGQRMLVVVAGVVMNIALGWALITSGLVIGFPQTLEPDIQRQYVRDAQLYVASILPDSPIAAVTILPGDTLVSIDGTTVTRVQDIHDAIADKAGVLVHVGVIQDGNTNIYPVTPQVSAELDRVTLGVGLHEVGTVSYPIHEAIWRGGQATYRTLAAIVVAFYGLITELVTTGAVTQDLAGPVGIAVLTGQVAERGFTHLLQFAAILSLNLAILNILPIPALDGGKLIFLALEALRRKPIRAHIEAIIHRVGFAFLLFLVLLVTYKDILRFFG
jgi:regulator of sigma E protease